MSNIFPDLLRAVITDIMLIVLLWTMATPKYKNKWVYIIVTLVLLSINLSLNYYFYLSKNYTAVVYIDLLMLLVIGIALKPLFIDKVMQWCFSYLTMLNIYAAVVVLSYMLCGLFPRPIYGNAYLRLFLFSIIAFIFHKYVSKLYRSVLENWHIYMLPIASLFLCFLSYFLGDNIEADLVNNILPLIFLILLGLSIYITIMYSFKTITNQYLIREENQTMLSEREYLHLAADGMAQRIHLMEDVSAKNSRFLHDRRHFNSMILELLEQGECEEAITLLKKQKQVSSHLKKRYCENLAVNAVVLHYATLAEEVRITTDIRLEIPSKLNIDSLELSMVISNLMENAIEACKKLDTDSYIHFTAHNIGRLLLEIKNPCSNEVVLDKKGYPIATEKGHGIGTKSIITFAKKYDAELIYKIENNVFSVRLLI